MKCFARCLLVLSIIFIGGVAVLGTCAWFAADWLNPTDTPVKADRMLILAGEPLRAVYAAELYQQGFSSQIYIARPVIRPLRARILGELGIPVPRWEDVYLAVLAKKGVKDSDVHVLGGSPVLSTSEEAGLMSEMIKRTGGGSLIVVTSPYHVRRAKIIFHDVMPGISITVVASPYEEFPKRWWTDQSSAIQVILEFAKICFYILGGRFTSNAPV